jgi:hypothetical protein
LKASNATSTRTAATAAEPPRSRDSSSSTAERFELAGPSLKLDPRVHACRRDLADIALAGRLFAPHYARPLVRACGARPAFLYATPSDRQDAASELLPGEHFAVLEYAGGWAWGYSCHDHYVGYVEAIELTDPAEPTHIVCEPSAPIHPDDDIRAPVLAHLPMGSRLIGEEHGSCLASEAGCIPLSYLRRIDDPEEDAAAVAQRLYGAPYRLGGRTANGVDCSGLVQLALALTGIAAPRDSDLQRVVGTPIEDGEPLRRGDLVFFEGHVGMMVDDLMMIHATRTAGKVCVEPLAAVAERSEGGVVARRRV